MEQLEILGQEEKDYYKSKRVSNLWDNSYIKYKRNGDGNRNLSLDEYLNKIKPYMRNIVIDLQNSDTWKIQLTIAINFISSKDAEEKRVMLSKSDNIKSTSYNDSNEVFDELFESFRSIYQGYLEPFILDLVKLMYYKFHRGNCRRGGSYIDSPDWIKKKKSTISQDDKCFQYAVTVALNYGEI